MVSSLLKEAIAGHEPAAGQERRHHAIDMTTMCIRVPADAVLDRLPVPRGTAPARGLGEVPADDEGKDEDRSYAPVDDESNEVLAGAGRFRFFVTTAPRAFDRLVGAPEVTAVGADEARVQGAMDARSWSQGAAAPGADVRRTGRSGLGQLSLLSRMNPPVNVDASRAHKYQVRPEQDDQPSPELPNWLPAV